MKKLALTAILLAAFGCAQQAPHVPLSTYTCYRTIDKITLDGALTEESWQKAPIIENMARPDGKEMSTLRTSARMVWDDEMLYIAFECEDPDLYATITEKDGPLYTQDVVEVFVLEQSLGLENFVEYEVSPTGVLFDCYLIVPYVGFMEWSSPFKAAARYTGTLNDPTDKDTGYTVEIAIPFTDFYKKPCKKEDAAPRDGSVIRMNLYRIDYSTPAKPGGPGANIKLMAWSPTIENAFHRPKRFGIVTFADWPVGKPRTDQ
jgi:hypothetical protein